MTNYVSLADIERDYDPGIGRHWFDADTLHFFRCRLPQCGYEAASGDRYFVTSECGPDQVRRYTIRKQPATNRHTIETVGDFGQYATRSGADKAAQRIARG